MTQIGLKIKQLVGKKRISATELAKLIGKKSKQSIYGYYNQEDVDTSILKSISKALNIPITWFFEDENRIEVLKEPGVQYYQNKNIIDHKDLIIEDLKEQLSQAHKEKEKAWEQVEFLRKIIEEKL